MSDLASSLGMPLDEWQEDALEAAMGERADGRWASKFIGMSVPRQNGKSQIIVARALAGVLLFGEKMIIISAHETDTAREVWKRLIDVVEDNPTLEARVTGRMDAINREFLSFGRGADKQTVKLKARRAGGSRGFSADCLLLDEAQILGKRAWASIVPTMSARTNPQAWLFGTPPTEDDDPFAFSRVRESSKAHKARHCWLEWAADPGDDYDDPVTWAKANPSFGVRISREACADDRAAMDDEQFGMERLGIWPDRARSSILPDWPARLDATVDLGKPDAVGIAASVDQLWGSIGAARMDGERVVVGAVKRDRGTGWLVAEALRIQTEQGCAVVVDQRGPCADLVDDLVDAGVRLTLVDSGDFLDACADFVRRVESGALTHAGHGELDAAVSGASWRFIGDRRAFGRKTHEISMLEGAVLATWGAVQAANYDVAESIY